MKNRIVFSAAGLMLGVTLVLGLQIYTLHAAAAPKTDSAYENIAVFTRALQMIRQDYVDEKKTTYESLTHSALRGMLSDLDPHSQFMEANEFEGMQDDTRSQFGGLGVVVSQREGKLIIVSPMEDTPGFKAGLMPGDQILKINGGSTERMDLNAAIELLRGQPGEPVTLTILRAENKEIRDFVVERAVIKVASVKDAKLLAPELAGDFKMGYARITQFNEPTAKDLSTRLDALEAEGMQAFILDLRNNPGGLLSSAVDVCGEFLPAGTRVVYTDGRVASQRRHYPTPPDSKNRRMPVAVLINSGSASGSEIVAGALKDLGRAVVVGETTFGKGSVQSVMPLPDGSALRLTTAKYYTPSREVIHEKGVAPSIRATMTPEQERLMVLLRREHSLTDAELREVESFRDPQLERAVDALKGVMIYAQRSEPKPKPAQVKREGQ